MLDKITKKITNDIILNLPNVTEEKANEIEYGLYMAFSDGLKLLAVLFTAFLLGQFKYAVLAVIVFSLNKSYLGGVHAKTQLGCVLVHFTLIFGTVYTAQAIHFKYLNIILFAVSAILALLYSPADLESKPIVTLKRKKELRVKSFVVLILLFFITFFMPINYSNVISIITLISTVNITPMVYKITKNRKGGVLNEN